MSWIFISFDHISLNYIIYYVYRVQSSQQCWLLEIFQVSTLFILVIRGFWRCHYHNRLFISWISLKIKSSDYLSHSNDVKHLKERTFSKDFFPFLKGKTMITKKGDGSQVKEKESTDSSTTLEDEDVKGKLGEFVSLSNSSFSLLKFFFLTSSVKLVSVKWKLGSCWKILWEKFKPALLYKIFRVDGKIFIHFWGRSNHPKKISNEVIGSFIFQLFFTIAMVLFS